MANTLPTQSKSAESAQKFLSIETIRDGIVVLKHAQGLRAVVMVSALNFALKSEDEQDALVMQYENLLNALDFSMQFVVQSRRLNIQPYLETLAARAQEETGELLKVQIAEYIEFVKTFVELSQIVSKTFYAVVPFQPSILERQPGLIKRLGGFWGGTASTEFTSPEDEFAHFKGQLLQRVDAVSLGLKRLGLRTAMLNTEELIELFYGLYNPTESQKITTTDNKRIE